MESIEAHIKKDKEILDDPTTNPAARRHYEEELHELEVYEAVSYTHLTLPTIYSV